MTGIPRFQGPSCPAFVGFALRAGRERTEVGGRSTLAPTWALKVDDPEGWGGWGGGWKKWGWVGVKSSRSAGISPNIPERLELEKTVQGGAQGWVGAGCGWRKVTEPVWLELKGS